MEINEITERIIGAAIQVHTALGPGLLESAYEACFVYELRECGLDAVTQVALPIVYKGLEIQTAYRLDILVNGSVIVELKSADKILPVHEAQLLSYLKLSGLKAGLLINFNVIRLRDGGIRRLVNDL